MGIQFVQAWELNGSPIGPGDSVSMVEEWGKQEPAFGEPQS